MSLLINAFNASIRSDTIAESFYCRAMLCISAAFAVIPCPSVCHVPTFCQNKHIFKTFHRQLTKPFWFSIPNGMTIFRRDPPTGASNAGLVGRIRDSEPSSHAVNRSSGKCNTGLPLSVMDHGEFITLVAGKRWSLSMAGNNDEVYNKKLQLYAEDNVYTQW